MASSPGSRDGQNTVENLAAFLRQNKADIKILTGKSKLSLTTVYLSILNRCFATTNPNDSEGGETQPAHQYDAESVIYLRDILHRAVALKLLHEGGTLQGAVDVSRFHALTVMEVKRVPIHLLVGLGSLRSQLKVLICSKCVHSLQMLLVGCGGDKAEGLDWPVLNTLNLSYNYIDALDESLRFLPALKALDLSHNNIRHTRDYFESLPELVDLNLSFNQLTRVPSLGEFIPSRIQTLLLRGNNIESLAGIEYLEELGTLDLAKNAIFDTTELFSLGYLHHLRKMYFHGNPFIFQGKWRFFVARYLSPEAAKLVTFIEDRPLSRAEIQVVRSKAISRPPRSGYLSDNFSASYHSSNVSYDNLDDTADPDMSKKKRRSKVQRATAKVRQVSIKEHSDEPGSRNQEQVPDQNAKSVDNGSNAPGNKAKKEYEGMRQMHGTDWLLALQNPYENVSKPLPSPSADGRPSALEQAVSNDSSIDIASENKTVVTADIHTIRDNNNTADSGPVLVEETVARTTVPTEEGKGPEDIINGQDVGTSQELPEENLPDEKSLEHIDLLMRQDSDMQIRIRDGDLNDEEHEGDEQDSPELCGPLLIRLFKTDPPVQLFVTVRERYIEEKNVFGKVVQRLELKSLKGMNMSIENMLDDFNNTFLELPVVKLGFDYINRDRRKREYVMEDLQSCQVLTETLQPILLQNEAGLRRVFLQCLKCMLEFPKVQAKRKVEKKARKSSAWISEEESGSDFESVNEVLVCPSCESTLMLEVDDPTDPRSEASTPYGSFASIDLQSRPMASSSPWKRDKDKNAVVINISEPYHTQGEEGNHSNDPTINGDASDPSLLQMGDKTKTNGPLSSGGNSTKGSTPTKDCSLTSSSSPSQLGADFRLPEPTIKMSTSVHTPVDELASYPPEKLEELLTTNKSGFRQRTTGALDSKPSSSKTSPGHRPNGTSDGVGNERAWSDRERSIYDEPRTVVENSKDNFVKNMCADHKYSEDDFVVLDSSDAISQHSSDYMDAYRFQGDARVEGDNASSDAVSFGRLDSNESDIAVISEPDPHSSSSSALTLPRPSSAGNLSINSDNVFIGAHPDRMSNTKLGKGSPLTGRRQQESDPARDLESSHEHSIYESHSDSGSMVDASGNFTSGSMKSSDGFNSMQDVLPSHSLNCDVPTNSVVPETSMLGQDCCNIHHRLKLFFSMSIFGNEEEFISLLKGTICQFSRKSSFDGLVVVSDKNVYVLKITKEESESPSDWLSKKTQHLISDLVRLHVGLGNQTVQLEFASDGILYTVVAGDKQRSRQFVTVVTGSLSSGIGKKYRGVQYEHPQTYLNLTSDIFVPQATGDTSYEVDPQVTAYVSGRLRMTSVTKQGTSLKEEPVGVLVTATDVYLVDENHFYPLALPKNRKGLKGQSQYTARDHRKISDILELDLYSDSPTDVTVSFFSEGHDGEEGKWNISTLSETSLDQLLGAIRKPWGEMFGVNIPETTHPSILIQDIAWETSPNS